MFSVSKLVSLAAAASIVPSALAIQLPSFLFKDVVVVGGGASGAHAAVRLREDYGKSVVLIEKQAILGGHVDSYTDPKTGFTMNYGVQNWIDQGNARAFFERLGVPVDAPGRLPTTTRYVDFTDGEAVNFTAPAMPDQLAALAKFRDIVEQWDDIIQPGYFNFPAPQNIPADLLLPFGQFVKKYGLESAVPFIFRTTGFGVGDVVNELTLYVVQAYGASMARSILGEQASLVPKSGRNQDLYDAVGKKLGADVLYSSTVIDAWRTSFGVLVTVQNSKTKKITIITARRLLMAIEPTADNLKPFGTDKAEDDVFSRFEGSRIYAGIVSNEALPVNFSLFNIPEAAAPSNTLVYPAVPFQARFDYFGSDKYFRVLVIAGTDLEPEAAKKLVQKNFETLIASGAVKTPANKALQWVALEDHGAMHLRVSAQELKAGFIQKQYALQGRRSTWWTGGAFSVQFQTALWDFNDVLLEKLVADM